MNLEKLFLGNISITIAAGAICGVFSLLNLFYSKTKAIKIVVHFIYTLTKDTVQQYTYRSQFLPFFLFIFGFVLTNNILSIFAFRTLFDNAIIVACVVCTNTLLGILTGIYYKGYHAITDLVDPSLPIALRFGFFPMELVSVSIRILMVFVRLYVFTVISHKVLDIVLELCENSPSIFMLILNTMLVIVVKLLDLFSGIMQAYIFTMLCAIVFGKFNKKIN